MTPEIVNSLAYECFWNDKPKDAITVINWAIQKFPDSHNLLDSQGEFYEKIGNQDKAKKSYRNAIKLLSKSKNLMDAKEYEEKMEYYKSAVERMKR